MSRNARSRLLISVVSLLFVLHAATGCDTTTESCQAGTEGCACAPGDECLSGLTCLSAVCVESGATLPDATNVTDTTVGDIAVSDAMGTGTDTSTTSTDTSIASDTSAADVPSTTDATDTSGTDDVSPPLEAQCPFPDPAGTATIQEGLAEGALDGLAIAFNVNGAMIELGAATCVAGDPTGFESRTLTECFDAYLCDGCPMVIGSRMLEGVLDFYLAPFDIPVPDGCESFGAFYSVASGD